MSLTPDELPPDELPTLPPPIAPTRKLLHGAEIPMLGLGTSPLRGDAATQQVLTALAAGYRLIDTAEAYGNEDAVGEAIRGSGLDRREIFLTSKFNREWHSVKGARRAFERSLERLGTDYLDLLLVHWPNPDQDHYVDAVRGLEELRREGLLHAIGTSNFKPDHLRRVVEEAGIVPDVNQVQLSPYSTRPDVRAFDDEYGIATEAWSPIGAADASLRDDPLLREIGERYDKSAVQVTLRWHVQLGLVAIPRSSNPARIAENIAVFDFELTDDEVEAISALDRGDADLTDSDVFGH